MKPRWWTATDNETVRKAPAWKRKYVPLIVGAETGATTFAFFAPLFWLLHLNWWRVPGIIAWIVFWWVTIYIRGLMLDAMREGEKS